MYPGLRFRKSTASPASTYSVSVAISCSFLRPWLGWAVELGFVWDLAADNDRAGQAAALVVSGSGPVPVVARAVELEGRPPLREVHQPDELGVAVGGQDRAVGVVVVVDDLELEGPPMREHEDAGVEHQLV